LKSLKENSQIILITHNRKVMESVSVLYGVTMEQPGISKLISVRMEDLPHLEQGGPPSLQ
jgi:chromosome segregation protein